MVFLSLVGGDKGLFSEEDLKEVNVDGLGLVPEFHWVLPMVDGYGQSLATLMLMTESFFGFHAWEVEETMEQRAKVSLYWPSDLYSDGSSRG
ncbi:hypothetical protein SLE2022_359660 [Rubroshorea leprosula]